MISNCDTSTDCLIVSLFCTASMFEVFLLLDGNLKKKLEDDSDYTFKGIKEFLEQSGRNGMSFSSVTVRYYMRTDHLSSGRVALTIFIA